MAVAVGVGALTLGQALDGLFGRVENLIDQARRAGTDVAQTGGNELRRTIQYARLQYDATLTTTMDRVDGLVVNWVNQLSTVVQQAEQGAQNLAGRAQALTNTLPMSRYYIPQVVSISPTTVFRGNIPNPEPVDFTVTGNFGDVANLANRPFLSFNGQRNELVANSGLTLCFRVPFAQIFPVNATNAIVHADGVLTIPWVDRGGILNNNKLATFNVLIGAFPSSPGRIVLHYKIERRETNHQCQGKSVNSQRGPEITEHGNKYEGNNKDRIGEDFLGRARAGWSIVSGTWSTVVHRADGSCEQPTWHAHDIQNNTVTFKATTRHKTAGSSGIMQFDIHFDEERYVVDDQQQTINLTWGQEHFIPSNLTTPTPHGLSNPWRVVFIPFDTQNRVTFTGHDTTSSRYLQMLRVPGGFKVVATLPNSTQS